MTTTHCVRQLSRFCYWNLDTASIRDVADLLFDGEDADAGQPLQPASPEVRPICGSLSSSSYRYAWKKASKSGHFLWKKRRRLDLEVIAPTADADAADESNVDDRQSASGAATEPVTN